MINEIILLLILLNISLCKVVFPFKDAYVNKNGEIDQNNKEYNYMHFMNDYYERLLYTTLEVGNPPKKIKVMLSYQDCGFKIGLAKRCIYEEEEYLSHYIKDDSSDFNYTDKYIYNIMEFDNGHSAEDSIKLYKDIDLKKYESFKQMDFYLGTDTTELLCGVVGFKMDRFDTFCHNMSTIRNFKSYDMIDNYKWIIKYNSDNEGLVIFGTNMNEIIKNYDDNNLYKIQARFIGTHYPWSFDIHLMTAFGDKNMTFGGHEMWIEINNDISVLIGNNYYEDYIHKDYFEDYINKNICYDKLWKYDTYTKYVVYECNKEKFGKDDIKKFPSISFLNRDLGTEIVFENTELFTETKYKYFYNVIFREYKGSFWVFGKPFLRKYPVIFDLDQNIIEIYKDTKKEEDKGGDDNNNDNSYADNSSRTKTILIIILIIVLVCVTGVLCYFLGKNLNKMRKKKANELADDEYDYTSKSEKEEVN